MPAKLAELKTRLGVYQATAVPKGFHNLTGVDCTNPNPKKHPEWQGNWMPFCSGSGPRIFKKFGGAALK